MASVNYIFTFIGESGLDKQTSVGRLFGIHFVNELKLIFSLFSAVDNIFVRYRRRFSFIFACHQSALNKKTMVFNTPV